MNFIQHWPESDEQRWHEHHFNRVVKLCHDAGIAFDADLCDEVSCILASAESAEAQIVALRKAVEQARYLAALLDCQCIPNDPEDRPDMQCRRCYVIGLCDAALRQAQS
jgi:hypothetical protein